MNQVSKSHRDLLTILGLLRRGPDDEAAEILRQVKSAPTLEDAVARIADATLLLPGGSPEQSRGQFCAQSCLPSLSCASRPRVRLTALSPAPGTASPKSSTWTYLHDIRPFPQHRRLASPYDPPTGCVIVEGILAMFAFAPYARHGSPLLHGLTPPNSATHCCDMPLFGPHCMRSFQGTNCHPQPPASTSLSTSSRFFTVISPLTPSARWTYRLRTSFPYLAGFLGLTMITTSRTY